MKKSSRIILFVAVLQLIFAGEIYAEEEEEELRRAVSLLEAQVKSHPEDPEARFNLGNMHYLLGRFLEKRSEEAIHTEKGKKEDARESAVHYNKSIAQFKECIKRQPNNMSAHFNISLDYYAKKEPEQAIIHMRKAQQLFMMAEEFDKAKKSRMTLSDWYKQFGFKPEDFDTPN